MSEIAEWIALFILAIGVAYSISKDSRQRDKLSDEVKTELKMEIGYIKDRLDDDRSGLGAIKESVDGQRSHCAGVVSGFEQRFKSLEKRN